MRDTHNEAAPTVWNICREGRTWTPEEFITRADRLLGIELEISRGKLFSSDETRMLILGMLLENVGIDAAVRLGNPTLWKEAVDAALRERSAG
jgi:hypothetical protein